MYRVEYTRSADRDIKQLKRRIDRRDYSNLSLAVRALAVDPRPTGVRKIVGEDNAWRIRVGSCRVVYDVYDGEKLVLIYRIARRSEDTYDL